MHHTGSATVNIDDNMSGWYVDNFRLGDLLPQRASMTVRSMTPNARWENHFNGYGVLAEAETSLTATTVDVLDTNNNVINDKSGNPMTDLSGDVIELWDIDSQQYRSVNLKFNFDSVQTAFHRFYGFSIGTRVGTGFNFCALARCR